MSSNWVQHYLQRYNLSQVVSDAINACVAAKATQPLSFLADHFTTSAKENGTIKKVTGYEIMTTGSTANLDVEIQCSWNGKDHLFGHCDAGAGATNSEVEIVDLLDNEERLHGKGVKKAAHNVGAILAPLLLKSDGREQQKCDDAMMDADSSSNKSTIGANAISATSMALAYAGAKISGKSLYRYLTDLHAQISQKVLNEKYKVPAASILCFEAGKHRPEGSQLRLNEISLVSARDTPLDIAVEDISAVFHSLEMVLSTKFKEKLKISDDGCYIAPVDKLEEILGYIKEAATAAQKELGVQVFVAIDFAANHTYNPETRTYNFEGIDVSGETLPDFFDKLITAHPYIVLIEDPAAINDTDTWRKIVDKLQSRVVVAGDDLFRSNFHLITTGVEQGWANGLCLKVNQGGTVTQAMRNAKVMQSANGKIIMAQRTHDSLDTFTADMAFGVGAWLYKCGGLKNLEKVQKLNRLIRIDCELRELDMTEPWLSAAELEALANERAQKAKGAKKK